MKKVKVGLIGLLVSTFTSSAPIAVASAPQLKAQAPGFYRTMIGKIEVTALFDGFFPIKVKEVLNKTPGAKIEKLLSSSRQGDVVPTSVNSFLLNTGTKLILVDTGCGLFFGPSFGNFTNNLKAAGYMPDQIDEVYVTHMHSDHLGGIIADGKATFPRAILRMDQRDADYWLNIENAKRTLEPMASMFANAVAAVMPYKSTGRFKPFHGRIEIAPGISAMPAYGHTPGHTVYSVESEGKKLLLVGDIIHIEAVQFIDPSISPMFDSDPQHAATQRLQIFKEAAAHGFLIGAPHLPFPGLGHVVATKPGFRYLPIPYAPVE